MANVGSSTAQKFNTRKKKVDADAHAARISTRGAVLRAAQQREWMAGVKLTFTVASMRLPSLTQ
jgi:hypothetical protein